MLNNNIFYHQITRKLIVAFGSLFSNIKIARKKDNTVMQTLEVPISYAPKEKWLVRVEQDPNLDSHTYTTLPRMSFEITGMSYDSSRKVNRMNYITCGDNDSTLKKVYSPVPYNYDVSLYVLSKTQEDALQIVEQILPTFTPEYTMSIKPISMNDLVIDVPIILNSVSIQDDYDGDFQTRRFVTYTLNFTLKSNMFGPVIDGKVITKSLVDVSNIDDLSGQADIAKNIVQGNPATGNVTQNLWNEF